MRHRIEPFLSVPLLRHGRAVGVINFQYRDPHRYGDRQIRLIAVLLVAAEIELALLESENSQLSARPEMRKLVEREGNYATQLQHQRTGGLPHAPARSRQRRKSMREVAEAMLLNGEIRHRPQ